MTTFTICDTKDGLLVPLSDLLGVLPLEQVIRIRLKDFRLHFGQPFGLTVPEFEARTLSSKGLLIEPSEFALFANTPMQIIDGTVEFELRTCTADSQLRLECIDASQWELSTDSDDVRVLLAKKGIDMR